MADFPIVDAHLHLWDTNRFHYSWLKNSPILNKPHTLTEYKKARARLNIEKVVFLQCECNPSQYKEEISWITRLAQQEPLIQGIVSWAPIKKGDDCHKELEYLAENKLVKGVRQIIESETDPEFCIKPGFITGLKYLPKFNLSFDICISHNQMPRAIKMVEQCPEVKFVLDHIGKPDIKNKLLHPWTENIRTLAEFKNISCKLSGIVTEADHEKRPKEDFKPYIDCVMQCFGIDRVFYGSDWPVINLASSYAQWLRVLTWATENLTENESRKLFRENAINFYNL